MKKQALLGIAVGLAILLFGNMIVSADIVIPTITKVYFELDGKPYNGKIDFIVKGYGYYMGMPPKEKEPGTYVPEEVFSFSSIYNNYGDKIYENYYMNYLHIDYFEVEGKTADGKSFVIKNIDLILTNCRDMSLAEQNNEYKACIQKASEQPAGTVRKDHQGWNWTKQADGTWTSPSQPGLVWGDGIWGDVCEEIANKIRSSENYYERECEIKLNLDNAIWNGSKPVNPFNPEPVKMGLWNKIWCFFKGLFGGRC